MNPLKLISTMSALTFVFLILQVRAEGQNLSPWPYSETCTGGGACFSITNNSTLSTSYGIEGSASGGVGVYGTSQDYFGVYGNSTNGYGVVGIGNTYAGVEGLGFNGVWGVAANSGTGAYGTSNSGDGVSGNSTSGRGVYGQSSSYVGVYGFSSTNNGVIGQTVSSTAAAITALSPSNSGLAYWGTGNIIISGSVALKAGGGPWTAPSDSRIKKDVKSFNQGLNELMQVKPVRYKYNGLGGTSDDGREYVGVIAQDIEQVMPAMVGSRMGKLHATDAKETAIKEVDPNAFTYALINAVQEQQRIIQRQEVRIAALEQRRVPVASLSSLGGFETVAAVGLLPIGLVVVIRRRKKQEG